MMYHIISGPTFDAAHTANNFTLVIQHLLIIVNHKSWSKESFWYMPHQITEQK